MGYGIVSTLINSWYVYLAAWTPGHDEKLHSACEIKENAELYMSMEIWLKSVLMNLKMDMLHTLSCL
jgi:hypothetical protein